MRSSTTGKSRTFGGKNFRLAKGFGKKLDADTWADKRRGQGYYARVVDVGYSMLGSKNDKFWGNVYSEVKRGGDIQYHVYTRKKPKQKRKTRKKKR